MSDNNGEVSPEATTHNLAIIQEAEAIIRNSTISSRAAYASQLGTAFDGARDYYTELGYPEEPQFDYYYGLYRRDGLGARVIESPAKESWRKPPLVLDGDLDSEYATDTPFVEEANAIVKRLKIWSIMNRLDIVTGIGDYGVLLIGVSGDKKLSDPLEAGDITKGGDSIIYLKPLHAGQATIKTKVADSADPRFGLVETYSVKLDEGLEQEVHHSRCIHIAENPTDNELIGKPRLLRVLNYLMDILKVVGGSAEIYWQIMDRGMQAELDPEYDLTPDQEQALEDEFEAYYHKLRRFIRTRGVKINPLGAGQVSDPVGIFKILVSLVSAATDIPQRKLLGSERGELASSQDDVNWASYVTSRQNNFTEPSILRPFFDFLVTMGAISAPSSGEYDFEFPSLFELNPVEEADVNKTRAETLNLVAPLGAADLVVPIAEARQELLGLPAVPPDDMINLPDFETRILDAETMTDVDGQPTIAE